MSRPITTGGEPHCRAPLLAQGDRLGKWRPPPSALTWPDLRAEHKVPPSQPRGNSGSECAAVKPCASEDAALPINRSRPTTTIHVGKPNTAEIVVRTKMRMTAASSRGQAHDRRRTACSVAMERGRPGHAAGNCRPSHEADPDQKMNDSRLRR